MDFRKIKSFVLLMCVIVTSSIHAQDRLEPYNQSIFDGYNERFQYYSKIRNNLFEKIHDDYTPLARYIVTPSFKPEYVLTFDEEYKEYDLTYTSVRNYTIWDTMDEPDKKSEVYKIKKRIDSSNSKLVVLLINNFIKNSKYQNPRYGNDGTNYYFSNSVT